MKAPNSFPICVLSAATIFSLISIVSPSVPRPGMGASRVPGIGVAAAAERFVEPLLVPQWPVLVKQVLSSNVIRVTKAVRNGSLRAPSRAFLRRSGRGCPGTFRAQAATWRKSSIQNLQRRPRAYDLLPPYRAVRNLHISKVALGGVPCGHSCTAEPSLERHTLLCAASPRIGGRAGIEGRAGSGCA